MKDMLLLDVTPALLGIETLGVMMQGRTQYDDPTRDAGGLLDRGRQANDVEVRDAAVSAEMAKDNRTLGALRVGRHPGRPPWRAQIEDDFDVFAMASPSTSARKQGDQQGTTHHHHRLERLDEPEIDKLVKGGSNPRSGRQAPPKRSSLGMSHSMVYHREENLEGK
ncbi:MAG: Hsp70 family protein [bacterium]